MNAQLFKDIFFFLGSVLGIVAFMKTLIEPMIENNRAKWKETKEHITEDDFINLEFDIWQARRIRDETWTVIRSFIRDIEKGAEYLRWDSVLKKHYQRSLQDLVLLYWKLVEYIQVPYWQPYTEVDADGNELRFREFNKQYFFQTDYKGESYVDHLEGASEIVEKMRIEFRKLSVLSNLHSMQIPFAARVLARHSQIPKLIPPPEEPLSKLH